MSLASMFERLGAPLHNVRWSWGAVRENDGIVFLRVWQDHVERKGSSNFVQIWRDRGVPEAQLGPAGRERLTHIQSIENGSSCFLVMCAAKDPEEQPRRIAHFNDREVFVGGELLRDGGDVFVELAGREPVRRLVDM